MRRLQRTMGVALLLLLVASCPTSGFYEGLFRFFYGRLPRESHYAEESVFEQGYAIEELVSEELLPYRNYSGDIYGIMVDAGSTGTRMQCFHFEWRPTRPYMHLVSDCFEQIEPGLSFYSTQPTQSVDGVAELIRSTQSCIPESHWSGSPIELKATAGLRLLPSRVADEILNNVEDYLDSTPFTLSGNNAVGIMEGIDEGVYAWFTVNYLKKKLHSHDNELLPDPLKDDPIRERTYGVIDLGGGSIQISFAPVWQDTIDAAPPQFIHDITVFKETFKLYSWSYLGLGLQSARFRLFGRDEDPYAVMESTERHLRSVCIHPRVHVSWHHVDSDFFVGGPLNESEYGFRNCYRDASLLVSSSVRHEDEIPHETFFALSYLFDKAVESAMIPEGLEEVVVTACDFLQAAKRTCRNAPDDVKRPFMCMDLTFIAAMLLDGLGFGCHTKIVLLDRIDGIEVSWSLGATFHMLNSYHKTNHVEWQRGGDAASSPGNGGSASIAQRPMAVHDESAPDGTEHMPNVPSS